MPVCELCGNTNFIKEEGMFVCQGCGTKYTVEEAKKLTGAADNTLASTLASAAETTGMPHAGGVVEDLAVAALATLFEALKNAADFKPSEAGTAQDARSINNYIAQGWQMVIADYNKHEHPVQSQLDQVLAKAKESLVALDNAAMLEPGKYVQNTLIYNNCIAIVKSVESLKCFEKKDGEWKKISFPVHSSDLKLPGQKNSWEEKRAVHLEQIEQEYLGSHEAEVAQLEELNAQAAQIQEQLDELKDEKKSKGFFNFADKKEVKERMAPVKEQLAAVNKQIRSIQRGVENYVEERLGDLSTSFTQLKF